jgi:predicted ester cyclase
MNIEANKDIVRRTHAAIIHGDLASLGELFTPDYIDHSRPGFPPGPEGVVQPFTMARAAMPDLHATLDELIAEGARVVARGTIAGTQTSALMGIPAMGKRIATTYIDINRIADGKIAERWATQDDLGMLQLLGLIPRPGAMGESA